MESTEIENDDGLWVFGYGSLCWHPGFEYKRSVVGHVKGFSRRFWQGNTTHRGTDEQPGRVVTLIQDNEGTVHGRAFLVKKNVALAYLENRECILGGYMTTISMFYDRNGKANFPAIIYVATNKNKYWLGDAPLPLIADQIFRCSGPSGHNVEYLLRLAEFMHRYVPEAYDDHLFTLERLVRAMINEENLCLRTLMGNRDFEIVIDDKETIEETEDDTSVANNLRENTFQFSLNITQHTTVRCLKM